MNKPELQATALALVPEGKGILAADESTGTITKRLAKIGVESNEETRRSYREVLFTAPGVEDYISGVILFDETIHQSARDGTPFAEVLKRRGIIPGIKVDMKAHDMAGFPGEKVTEGLDGLRDRFSHYTELGARFAKWRAVIAIGEGIPTRACIEANAHALARYAALAQEAGLVPIVEPEVLMDGSHDIARCEEVTGETLRRVFSALGDQRVLFEGMLLKPNMVVSGKESPERAGPERVAECTVRCLRRFVPAAMPGVVFLSGGQGPEEATENLNAINSLGDQPWQLSFSFARALQGPVMETWRGEESKVQAAQRVFYHRAKMNGAARYGEYTEEMEKEAPARG
ncbi:MAG: fructose-bisphosphate aldolase class I [Nitrospirota bacterium]|jgi:fructose-bisphosphate aldolase class I